MIHRLVYVLEDTWSPMDIQGSALRIMTTYESLKTRDGVVWAVLFMGEDTGIAGFNRYNWKVVDSLMKVNA